MNSWQRWIQAPKTHLFRKVLFQLHLWMGIGSGFYVLIISLSGSALLLQPQFYIWFDNRNIDFAGAIALEGEALTAKMKLVYAGYEVGWTKEAIEPDIATYVVLHKDGNHIPHYFNQYTGEDIGPANPWPIKIVDWLGDFHDDLLLGQTGKTLNGIGGLIFVLMSLSGALIWWRGRTRWIEGLQIKRRSNHAFIWQLHSFIGFWSLLLMFAWGISGFQLGFPEYMDAVVSWLDTDLTDFDRPDSWLLFFRRIHFTLFGEGPWVRWGWIIVSFLPTVLFISGFILWWRRVVLNQIIQLIKGWN